MSAHEQYSDIPRGQVVASSYDVRCTWAEADRAREVLAGLTNG